MSSHESPDVRGDGTQRRWFTGSIRNRFLYVLLALAILPLLTVMAIVAQRTFLDLQAQSVTLQREAAANIGGRVEATLHARAEDLAMLDNVMGLSDLSDAEQRTLLRNLLANQAMYQTLAVVDAEGRELIRLERDGVVLESQLQDRAGEAIFVQAAEQQTTQFGPLRFDESVREPLTTVAHPIVDRRTGELDSVLAATVTFKPIWELLARLDLPGDRDVYVLNTDGQVVAHRNPAVVLRGTTYAAPAEDGRAAGLSGSQSVVATHVVRMGDGKLTIVAEEPLASALLVATRALRVTIIVTLLALLAVTGAVVLVTRRIVRPIEALAESARRITAGDLTHRAEVGTDDEIGHLASAFNQMTVELKDVIGSLERRVADRTLELEQATEVQRDLISELEAKNTQLLAVQERLEDSLRSKDEFLGSVSHELRTPLACVVGFAAELRDGYESFSHDERLEFVRLIANQGQDMSDIINDLLVAARADAGALVVEPTSFEIGADVRSVVDQLMGARVRVQLPGRHVFAFADEGRVRQILRNLLINADRYGGPLIELSVEEAGDHVIVQVRDSGEGIPRDQWDQVFDPYQRAARGTSNPASVGLGLTVSRTLARCMAGDLSYRYEDGWSIFELTLPTAGESVPVDADAA